MKLGYLSSYLLAGVILFSTNSFSSAQVAPRIKPPFPQISLPDRESSGQRAITLLGARLPEVAAWYGMPENKFRSILLNDKTARISQEGRLFYVEEYKVVPPQQGSTPTTPQQGVTDGGLVPLDQTFTLHSKPTAQRTIYLNFKGKTVTNTAWTGSNTIIAPPYSADSTVSTTFTTTELNNIQYIWQRVSEDYAPFDVDVTTEQPLDPGRITRSSSTDLEFGTEVLITAQSAGLYPCSCGGVAYLGIFDNTGDYYKPALVFWDMLGTGNEKYVAEAISHEAGHNLGLNHDGTSTTGYYSGHTTGTYGWAPIMGVGYYQSLVQWSKGEYPGANNKEDDYVVIQSNTLPLRADDHGNSQNTTLSSLTSSVPVTGIIETPTDVDVFTFWADAGTANITLSPAARSGNLDSQIRLLNSTGAEIAIDNSNDKLGASFLNYNLPVSGAYAIEVRGVGKGDLTTGYSNYGSLGNYTLNASFPTYNGSNNNPNTLSYQQTGTGGYVQSSPVGIDSSVNSCSSSPCTASYDPTKSVVLTATANPGSTFGGWSGDCSGTSLTCTVPMDISRKVNAIFNTAQAYTLTVSKSGSGTVASTSPTGINCGATCSASFNANTQVTLTATPGTGAKIQGWSGGGCSGTSTTCTVVPLNSNITVSVTFVKTTSKRK